jgi:surface antigen
LGRPSADRTACRGIAGGALPIAWYQPPQRCRLSRKATLNGATAAYVSSGRAKTDMIPPLAPDGEVRSTGSIVRAEMCAQRQRRARHVSAAVVVALIACVTPQVGAASARQTKYDNTPSTSSCSVGIMASATRDPEDDCGPLTVPRDRGAVMPWGQCTYWAIEKRPDLLRVVQDYRVREAAGFARAAQRAGYLVSRSPAVGDIAVWAPGVDGAGATTGHVAYVEAVDADGSYVVSEMNGGFGARLDIRRIPSAEARDARFIGQLPPGHKPVLPVS